MALLRPNRPLAALRSLGRLVLLGATLCVATGARAGAPGEYEVKAAFLYNFARFVEWPAGAMASGSDFVICVVGGADVAGALERVVAGRSVAGRSVAVRSGPDTGSVTGCQILFATDEGTAEAAQQGLGPGVLTVGERQRFARDGGMINFVLVDKKIRFEINTRSAQGAGLTISSHLLKLAHDVYE